MIVCQNFIENGFQTFLFENDFKSVFPELFLLSSTLFLLVYGVFLSSAVGHHTHLVIKDQNRTLSNSNKAGFVQNELTRFVQAAPKGSAAERQNKVRLTKKFLIEDQMKDPLALEALGLDLKVPTNSTMTTRSFSQPLLLQNMCWLSLLSLLFTLALFENNFLTHGLVFYGSLIRDDFTLFFQILVVCGAFFSILISLEYFKGVNINFFESVLLIMISTFSMLLLIGSADLISMYLAIELQSFCFYIMAASKRNSEFSTEAGLKYFLLGAFSSGILLFGCSLIYGFTGITNFAQLSALFTCGASEFLPGIRGCELGMIFIIVGFLFKLTAAPFHMWAPDVYEGAPTSVTAFFSIVPKISILAIFARLFLDSFFDFMLPWQKICIFCSGASMIIGALAALSQSRIKRFLAFSSVGHVGYLLVGFCCGTMEGLQSLLIYLIVYVIMTCSIFALLLSPIERSFEGPGTSLKSRTFNSVERKPVYPTKSDRGGYPTLHHVKYITDFAQLGKTNSLLAMTLSLTMFSIAGIPPLAGFYSKAALFFAAMSSEMYLLAVIGVLTSVCSCFYYIRLVKIMYFEPPKQDVNHIETKQFLVGGKSELNKVSPIRANIPLRRTGKSSQIFHRISKENSITLALSFFFISFFLLYPSPLYLATHKVALSLCV